MAEIIFTRDGEIQAVSPDVTIEENHQDGSDLSDHPIEEGSDASDGKHNKPSALTLTVFVTNHPIVNPPGGAGEVQAQEIEGASTTFARTASGKKKAELQTKTVRQTVNVLSFPESPDRVRTVYAEFLRLKEENTILLIVTSLREYESMVISDIGARKDSKTGDACSFVIGLREFNTVSTETVETPEPLETRAEAERRRGATGTEEEESEERVSFAAAAFERFSGMDLLH